MTLKPPKHLRRRGRQFYLAIARAYVLQPADEHLLIVACEALDRMEAAQSDIRARGELVEDRYGQRKLNPAVTMERDSRAGFLAAFKQLRAADEDKRPVGRPPRPIGIRLEDYEAQAIRN